MENDDYKDKIEIEDCQICGVLLPENLVCPQCGTSHEKLLMGSNRSK